LDKEFIESLNDLDIRSVQITFDGNKSDHDKLRKQRNSKGSFDQIFNNIFTFCRINPECHLILRINCCDNNYGEIGNLLKRFPPAVIERTSIFFRWIYPDEANGYQNFVSRGPAEMFSGLAELYTTALSMGWRTLNPHLTYSNAYCEVDQFDHYAIDPIGNIFLCGHSFKESESIGSLFNKDQYIRSDAVSKQVTWYSTDPFDDSNCIACKLLPVCEGGCRKLRVETGKRICIEEKYSPNLFVKNILDERLMVNQIK
jgi:uncharacterized protein